MAGRRSLHALRFSVLFVVFGFLALVACAAEGGQGAGEPPETPAEQEPDDGEAEGTADSADKDTEPLRVGWNPVFTHAPLSVGRQLGAFEDAGVDIEWIQVETPPDAVSAILAGDMDITAVPPPTMLVARGEGAPLVAFATTSTGETDPPLFGYAVRQDSGIESVQDLPGRSVGINNFGGNFDLHLRYHLEQNGLDPEDDVDISVVNLAVAVQSLLQNQVDAAGVVTAGIQLIEQEYPDELELLFTTNDIEGIDYDAGYPVLVMVAAEDFLANNRETVLDFMRGYAEAVDFISSNPDEAKRMWAEDTGVDAWGALQQMASFPNGPTVPEEGVMLDMELMVRYGYLDQEFEADEIIDNSFAEEVMNR